MNLTAEAQLSNLHIHLALHNFNYLNIQIDINCFCPKNIVQKKSLK